jgi:hypothetical protein
MGDVFSFVVISEINKEIKNSLAALLRALVNKL